LVAVEASCAAPTSLPHTVVKALKRGRIWDKCGGRCHYCGCELHPFWTFTIDHLIPKSRGGTNAIENLVAACPDCNHAKGDSLVAVPAVGGE
jgi:5-methylcytosine-specific restriction endonuclease McrA